MMTVDDEVVYEMETVTKSGERYVRKGRTLHLPYEVLLGNPATRGGVTSLTLALLHPAAWYVGLYMGAVGDRRYRTSCDGFAPDELERIEEGIDGSTD